ncbi:hypothetical protein U724_06910 [Pseudomonas chlororaphis subsp. aurantiaca PB-St2]|nr:hypothetical protein U724_06910 [Pseudomonas chlororaphis subsp. aurantiaca PB-St2]
MHPIDFEILVIIGFLQSLSLNTEFSRCDPAKIISNLLQASDLQPLAQLNGMDEVTDLAQRLMSTCIQPGESSTQHIYIQHLLLEVNTVDISDLQLTAPRRFMPLAISTT